MADPITLMAVGSMPLLQGLHISGIGAEKTGQANAAGLPLQNRCGDAEQKQINDKTQLGPPKRGRQRLGLKG